MTLIRELALYLTILLLLLFSGSFVMNIIDARSYLQDQLESHAQDTATSLGVAIATTEPDNKAAIDSLVDVVFDRGYYRLIRFVDQNGNLIASSQHELRLDDVPVWFIKLVNLEAPMVASEVNRGWMPAGIIFVASHPGNAYRSLWSKTLHGLLLFGGGLLLAILGLNLLLNVTLRPLKKLEKQANAICERSFVQQNVLPKNKDLRRVVEAMNRMAGNLEEQFAEKMMLTEELRKRSVKDALTGILNRRAFDDRIANVLQDEERGESGGALLMAQISGLDGFNKKNGRNAADLLLVDIAGRISRTVETWPEAVVGRRSGTVFCVFVPACDLEQSRRVTEACFRAMASLPFFLSEDGQDRLHIATVTHVGRTNAEEIIQESDRLLRGLQHQSGRSGWEVKQVDGSHDQPYHHWSEGNWQESLKQVLKGQEVELFVQTVYNTDRKSVFREVFARLRLLGELAPAEAFLPMVERFDLHADFDKLVVETLIVHMRKDDGKTRYCVNLSPRSLLDDGFTGWLLETLNAVPDVTARLILEVPERTLVMAGEAMPYLVRRLVKTGCRFSIDHFGIASRSITSLHELELDYIKVDGSFVRGLCNNQGNQFYIRTLAMLAKSRDILLLAQDVEQEEDWLQLQELGVQGGQGYYLGRPQRL
ncbi:hypothetical protein GZ77_18215 [Endozoicomonas montiporae]|uniref:Diguanylate cyclase n=2 Tax=Endozoicomonas montiporae TaxID=1027273 RepID=A0A081N1Y4_9GAMM|nr:EAL domain-containing protein [Endozoicomonas montiporae]AMO58592.1 diguanylate cyclase/phosphodiesterase [Endozoicomonas montiporae CL-33]KEQ12457.1 hypothetical protein GZ77_18215 [Endozoicomonas montiporae]